MAAVGGVRVWARVRVGARVRVRARVRVSVRVKTAQPPEILHVGRAKALWGRGANTSSLVRSY